LCQICAKVSAVPYDLSLIFVCCYQCDIPNVITKRKKINITVEVSYDPEQIQRTVNLAKLVDVADNNVEEFAWGKYPVEARAAVLSANQLLNVSQELNITFQIKPAEGDLMEAQNFRF
jgi:hypothetical protein